MRNSSRLIRYMICLMVVGMCAWVFAQAPPAAPAAPAAQAQAPRPNPFGKPPTNLMVLKVENAEALRPIMMNYTASLGVNCAFCHDPQDFAKDSRHKDTARVMIGMVDGLNASISVFNAPTAPKVTCFMCHQGVAEPEANPPARTAPAGAPAAPSAPPSAPMTPAAPSMP